MTFSKIYTNDLEFETLVQCVKLKDHSSETITALEELLSSEVSWPLLARLSIYHAVYPRLYQNLAKLDAALIPEGVMERFQHAFRNTAAHNLQLTNELGRVSNLLGAEDIPVIAFKGPVLAQVAYRNLGLRPCTDLDILIPPQRYKEVEEVLIEDGYSLAGKARNLSPIRKSLHLYLSQQQPFVRDRKFGLDVHLRIMPPGYLYNTNFETLLERSKQVPIAGVAVQSFEPEDLIQILCYHGVKNRWERLKHVCDVAELVDATPDLDWDTVLRRARSTRGTRILHMGLFLAFTLLDVKLAPDVLKEVNKDKQAAEIGSWVIARLPEQMQLGVAEFKERVGFHLRLQDNVFGKLRYSIYSLLRQMDDTRSS